LLTNVEDVGGHDIDIDAFHVLCLWERVDILDDIVNVFHQTHFDECFVLQIKRIPVFKRPHEKLTEETHDTHTDIKVDVFHTHLWIQ